MPQLTPRKARAALMALHFAGQNDGPFQTLDELAAVAPGYVPGGELTAGELPAALRMQTQDLVMLAARAGADGAGRRAAWT